MMFRRAYVSYDIRPPNPKERIMDWTLEVVVLPVSDIDRSAAFYRDQLGFRLDHDTRNEHMHVVQLTPAGSGCSVVFGDLPTQNAMEPGSLKGLQLVVADAGAARQELLDRGVEVSDLMVMAPTDGGTFFGFNDPDGNSWAVQEIKARAERPLLAGGDSGLRGWAG
jgi:catechol 2,3-dioxygenase-like lactoylglutathione lyase family enzyme